MSDLALLGAISYGENLALRDLFYRHGNRVYRILRGAGNIDRRNLTEAVKETFLLIARSTKLFDERCSVAGWVVRVAFRMATRFPRADSGRAIVQRGDDDRSEIHAAVLRLVHPEGEAEDTPLEAAIALLPSGPRKAIVLIDCEGMSDLEASDALRVPARVVWRWVSEARWRLAPLRAGRPGLHLLARAGRSVTTGIFCPPLWKVNRAILDPVPRIGWHLSTCAYCQREHAVLTEISARLASLPRREVSGATMDGIVVSVLSARLEPF
jgi:DNA-directed RNA polymerase specialized sigma24 family protein